MGEVYTLALARAAIERLTVELETAKLKAESTVCMDQFTQGYLCAVANLLQSHGDSQEVTDLLQGIGDLSQAQIDEYDKAIFIEHGYLEVE